MTMRGGIQSRTIKGGGGEKVAQIVLHPYALKIKKLFFPPLKKNMSASPPMISMLDEEDAWIHEYEIALKKVKEE